MGQGRRPEGNPGGENGELSFDTSSEIIGSDGRPYRLGAGTITDLENLASCPLEKISFIPPYLLFHEVTGGEENIGRVLKWIALSLAHELHDLAEAATYLSIKTDFDKERLPEIIEPLLGTWSIEQRDKAMEILTQLPYLGKERLVPADYELLAKLLIDYLFNPQKEPVSLHPLLQPKSPVQQTILGSLSELREEWENQGFSEGMARFALTLQQFHQAQQTDFKSKLNRFIGVNVILLVDCEESPMFSESVRLAFPFMIDSLYFEKKEGVVDGSPSLFWTSESHFLVIPEETSLGTPTIIQTESLPLLTSMVANNLRPKEMEPSRVPVVRITVRDLAVTRRNICSLRTYSEKFSGKELIGKLRETKQSQSPQRYEALAEELVGIQRRIKGSE